MEIEDYFTPDIAESWSRCLPVWSESGRVEDKPHGVRRPIYIPSLGKELGYEFATRFRDQWEFLVPKLESSSHLDRICAFDLLELIAWEYYTNCEDLPAAMEKIGSPIPEPALSDIHNEHFFKDFTGQTVGQFLPFLVSHG